MSSFVYAANAPVASVTLRREGASDLDVTFHPGALMDLPADHAYVRRLVARGLLTAVHEAPVVGLDRPPLPAGPIRVQSLDPKPDLQAPETPAVRGSKSKPQE